MICYSENLKDETMDNQQARFVQCKEHPNYWIFDDGRIYSMKIKDFHPCCKNGRGYIYAPMMNSVHYWVATYFIPNPNKHSQINHMDGNKENNHYLNLEWCTASENNFHKTRVLGKCSLENHPSAKLKNLQVHNICQKLLTLDPRKEIKPFLQEIANEFDTSFQAIVNIWNCNRWGKITKHYVQTSFRDHLEREYTQASGNGEQSQD